jgi:hypothetical protein
MDLVPIQIQMLEELPADLRARGWQLVRGDTEVYRTADSVQYIAVYVRPFDLDADDQESLSTMPHDRGARARVSTNQAGSASWEDAHRDAIQMMRKVDGRRQEQS